MTGRIFVFGNSHCACLKEAIDRQPKPIRERFVFFASRAKRIRDLEPRDNKLVPTNPALAEAFKVTAGGIDEISFESVSSIVLVGLGLRVRPFPNVVYSSAVKAAAINRIVKRSTLFWLAQQISEVTDLPMLAFHDPLPAETGATKESCNSSIDYLEVISRINENVSKSLNLKILAQPLSTREGWLTKMDYSVGSKRLAVGATNDYELHPESDLFHMNGSFGELLLKDIRKILI